VRRRHLLPLCALPLRRQRLCVHSVLPPSVRGGAAQGGDAGRRPTRGHPKALDRLEREGQTGWARLSPGWPPLSPISAKRAKPHVEEGGRLERRQSQLVGPVARPELARVTLDEQDPEPGERIWESEVGLRCPFRQRSRLRGARDESRPPPCLRVAAMRRPSPEMVLLSSAQPSAAEHEGPAPPQVFRGSRRRTCVATENSEAWSEVPTCDNLSALHGCARDSWHSGPLPESQARCVSE